MMKRLLLAACVRIAFGPQPRRQRTVEINDETIAAGLTDHTVELALPAAPRT